MTNLRAPATPYAYDHFPPNEKGPQHYANVSYLKISHPFDQIFRAIDAETLLQPLFDEKKAARIARKQAKEKKSTHASPLYKKDLVSEKKAVAENKAIPNQLTLEREDNGSQHAARVSVLTEVIFRTYNTFGNDAYKAEYAALLALLPDKLDEAKKEAMFLKLLAITAYCHDLGRTADNDEVKSEQTSAADCELLLTALLKNEAKDIKNDKELKQQFKTRAPVIAHIFADAIRKKQTSPLGKQPKGLLARIIYDADRLDSMRLPAKSSVPFKARTFCVNSLELWKDSVGDFHHAQRSFIDKDSRFKAQNALMKLVFEWRSVIDDCFDLHTSCPITMQLARKAHTKDKPVKIDTIRVCHGVKPHYNKKEKLAFEQKPFSYLLSRLIPKRAEGEAKIPIGKYPLLKDVFGGKFKDIEGMKDFSVEPEYLPFRFAYYNLVTYIERAAYERILADGKATDSIYETGKLVEREKMLIRAMQDLARALSNPKADQATKFEALNAFCRLTDKYKDGQDANIRSGIAFFVAAGISAVLGAAIGLIAGLAGGTLTTGPVGGVINGFLGMLIGTAEGWLIGGSIMVSALSAGYLGAKATHYHSTNTFFNNQTKMLAKYAENIILAEKPQPSR